MNIDRVAASVRSVGTSYSLRQNFVTPTERIDDILGRIESRREIRAATALRDELTQLQKSYFYANQAINQFSATASSGAQARSTAPVNLNTGVGFATLNSSEPVNDTTSAYNPTDPQWEGASTATATISGIYNGNQGIDTITFEVRKQGVHGQDNIQIDVFDGGNNRIDRFNVNKSDPIDALYQLSNGLEVEFSAGTFSGNDTFTVDVAAAANLLVDPAAAFDGSSGSLPGFETGLSVNAGSLEINGVSIAVAANDSIDTVLANITVSAANVTASYNSNTEQIELIQKTAGALPSIVLSNDTTGFFAATKLDTAIVQPGDDSELVRPMASVASLAGISAGTLQINGENLAIDPLTDSFLDIVDRINAQLTDVLAEYEPSGHLRLESNMGSDLSLDSNGTAFFETFNIASATYEPTIANTQPNAGAQLYDIVQRTAEVTRRLNTLLKPSVAPSDKSSAFHAEIGSLLNGDFKDAIGGLGLSSRNRYVSADQENRVQVSLQPQTLLRHLVQRYDSVAEIMMSPTNAEAGFLQQLISSIDNHLSRSAPTGSLIDIFV